MSYQRHILKRYIVPKFVISGTDLSTPPTFAVYPTGEDINGEGFEVGDVLEIAGGTAPLGQISVDTVGPLGQILTFSVDTNGSGYTDTNEEVGSILTSNDGFVNADDFYTFDIYQASEEAPEAGTSTYSPAVDSATLDIGTHVGGAGATWADPDNTGQRFVDNIPTVLIVRKGDQAQLQVQKTWIDGGAVEVYAEPGHVDRNGNLVGQTIRAEDITDETRCVAAGFVWTTAATGDAGGALYGYCREIVPADVDGTATDQADCPIGYAFLVDDCNTAWTAAEVNDGTAEAAMLAATPAQTFVFEDVCLASGNHYEGRASGGAVATYTVATNVASAGSISGGSGYNVGDVVEVAGDTGVTFTVDNITAYSTTNDKGGAIVAGTLTGTVSTLGDATYTDVATVGTRCVDATVADNFSMANFNYPTQSGALDYARTTCKQYGFYWEEATRTCKAYVDPSTLLTKADCIADGHVWIAGTCYDGADFGDGMNRVGTSQQDPTQKPK